VNKSAGIHGRRRNVIDHIGFTVSNVENSKAFYVEALRPLEISLIMEVSAESAGFGADNKAYFWIGDRGGAGGPIHVAFTADSRAQVDAFYNAALEAGGTGNGAPGLRPHYHENYYGAFVLDPDGNNIEAVCHRAA
jgi:catechol 2,3-dioxygenase-like lactoylglutathione lyase family enzyme